MKGLITVPAPWHGLWTSWRSLSLVFRRPKSEAWLLCALKADPYQYCAGLESLSGNDASPNSAKKRLEMLLQDLDRSSSELSSMVESGDIDPRRIDMESFNRFKDRLMEVVKAMGRSAAGQQRLPSPF